MIYLYRVRSSAELAGAGPWDQETIFITSYNIETSGGLVLGSSIIIIK